MKDDHRYLEAAHRFDDELVADLTAHVEEQGQRAEEKRSSTEEERRGGLDAVVKGTPLDQVKAIIEKKKRPSEQLLKEHEVGKKMAGMSVRGIRTVEGFLGSKG
jgi:hypothetical protein